MFFRKSILSDTVLLYRYIYIIELRIHCRRWLDLLIQSIIYRAEQITLSHPVTTDLIDSDCLLDNGVIPTQGLNDAPTSPYQAPRYQWLLPLDTAFHPSQENLLHLSQLQIVFWTLLSITSNSIFPLLL